MITTTKNVRIPRLLAIVVIAVALFAPLPAQAQAVPVSEPATFLIQFRPSVTAADRAAWIANVGAVEVDWMPQIGVATVQFDPNSMAMAASASSPLQAVSARHPRASSIPRATSMLTGASSTSRTSAAKWYALPLPFFWGGGTASFRLFWSVIKQLRRCD